MSRKRSAVIKELTIRLPDDEPAAKPRKRAAKLEPIPVGLVEIGIRPAGGWSIAFPIIGRAVPWKVPLVTRSGISVKDKTMLAWQRLVAAIAREHMDGLAPYVGPVELHLTFHLTKARNGSQPDTTNLVKCTEDALQGTVFVNDRQVRSIHARRVICDADWVQVRVVAD